MSTKTEIKEAVKIAAKIEFGKVIIKKVKSTIQKKVPKKVANLLKHKASDGILGFIIGNVADKIIQSGFIKEESKLKKLRVISECFKLSSAVMTSDALGVTEKALGFLDKLNLDKILPESE